MANVLPHASNGPAVIVSPNNQRQYSDDRREIVRRAVQNARNTRSASPCTPELSPVKSIREQLEELTPELTPEEREIAKPLLAAKTDEEFHEVVGKALRRLRDEAEKEAREIREAVDAEIERRKREGRRIVTGWE